MNAISVLVKIKVKVNRIHKRVSERFQTILFIFRVNCVRVADSSQYSLPGKYEN